MTSERRGKKSRDSSNSKKGLPISGGPSLFHEEELHSRGVRPVAGVDEAGRGPLAGPVVAAAVILPEGFALEALDDSKKLNHAKREELYEKITRNSGIHYAIAEASSQEIGHLNILRATHLAMRRSLDLLKKNGHPPAHALVDGLTAGGLPVDQTPLVGGDGLSLSIAAASILAKVTRDRIMEVLDREFPQYGFAIHRGYATADHLAMLRLHGPCPHHRLGFAPVDQPGFDF